MTGGGLFARWYAPLLGGLLPILLLGFLASALADRIVFAGWGIAFALLWTVVLREGLDAGWTRRRRLGSLALLAVVALGAFAALAAEHGEDLDLGFRAVFGPLHPAAGGPP
ncbi:MAG: hypothetical protein ACRD2T_16310 [Thermoanaerobaculia bacterium]